MTRTVSTFSSSFLAAALLTLTGASAMARSTNPVVHHGKATKSALVAKAETSVPATTEKPSAAAPAQAGSTTKVSSKGEHKARKTVAKSEMKADAKTEMKSEAQPQAEAKSEVKTEAKPGEKRHLHLKAKSAVASPEGASVVPAAPVVAAPADQK